MKKEFIPNDMVVFEKYDWKTLEDPKCVYLDGIYAHGKIQDVIGHDIIRIHSGFDNIMNNVINRCAFTTQCFMTHKGKLFDCTMFFWVCGTRNRGLVVLNDDIEGMKDAKLKFIERRCHL